MIRSRLLRGAYPSWIEVIGFKSMHSPARICIQPLTLLAGANSSGKSSVFQPLLLLKQSMELHYDPDPLLLDGLLDVKTLKTIFGFKYRRSRKINGKGSCKNKSTIQGVEAPGSRGATRRILIDMQREATKRAGMHRRSGRSSYYCTSPKPCRLEVQLEKPVYDLTVFATAAVERT